MTMTVSGNQVETLQAALAGDSDKYHRLNNQLDPAARTGFNVLIASAFFKAAYRKFSKNSNSSSVVEFVGSLRTNYDLVEEINPDIAERLLLATFTDAQIDDIDDQTKGEHYLILLIALIKEAELSGTELDAFLSDARGLADRWLADVK